MKKGKEKIKLIKKITKMNSIANNSSKCLKHNKDYSYLCLSDNNILCDDCFFQHKSLNHNIIDRNGANTVITQNLPQILSNFRQDLLLLSKIAFPKKNFKKPSEENFLNDLQNAYEKLLKIINSYFSDIREKFQENLHKFPSEDLKEELIMKIENFIKEIMVFEEKSLGNALNFFEIKDFYENNFIVKEQEISYEIKFLAKISKNLDNFLLPTLSINENILEGIFLKLNQFLNVFYENEKKSTEREDFLNIKMRDYFKDKQEKAMILINENESKICLRHLEYNKTKEFILKTTEEIPYGHSLIATPDSEVFINGGILMKSGLISRSNFKFQMEDISLVKRANMIVKRIGHSLIFLEDDQFSIILYFLLK